MGHPPFKQIKFNNPEAVTEAEVLEIFSKYPIDFIRVKQFLIKEPGIREAFLSYTKKYITEFSNSVGIEFKQTVYSRLQEILLICLTAGFLTKENLFNAKLEKSLTKDGKDATTSTD